MVKLPLSKLNDLFATINGKQDLYLPVDTEKGEAEYKKWQEGFSLSSALNTNRSAKDFFFPQTENIAEFKMEGKNIEVIDTREDTKDFVVFGVKACDAKSFEILDRVFLVEPVDTMYKNRRDNAVVFTLACNNPHASCFCKVFDIDASSPKGDVECYNTSGYMYFNPITEKGKNMVEKLTCLTDSDSSSVETLKSEIKEKIEKLPFSNLDLSIFKGFRS